MAVNISIELLRSLLAKTDPQAVVDSFQVTPGPRGRRGASLYRVRLEGSQKREGQTCPWSWSLVFKCAADDPERPQASKADILFRNEVAVYSQALPALMSFQASCSRRLTSPFTGAATCHMARSERIVLEDLQDQGFAMADPRVDLDKRQCDAVLQELARLHALSLAMKCCQSIRFQEAVVGRIQETVFLSENEERYHSYYHAKTRDAYTMVRDALPGGPAREKYLEHFKLFTDSSNFFDRMVNLASPREPLSVLCHGACTTQNFTFRESPTDRSTLQVRLVNWQNARYASPALDLATLLYCCTSHALRTSHLRDMLAAYHATLAQHAAELVGTDVASAAGLLDTDTLRDNLQDEFHRCGRFGLGLALDSVPVLICDADRGPPLHVTPPSDGVERRKRRLQAPDEPTWTTEDVCPKKLAELVRELVDSGDL